MNLHKKFIETPVSDILKEAILAINPVGSGIETYPLLDYVMQSVFIKMTGAQEQKLKCIAWELATNDFSFRQDFLKNFNVQFSEYKHKNELYKVLLEQISICNNDFLLSEDVRRSIISDAFLGNIISNSNLEKWSHKEYQVYKQFWSEIKEGYFANQKTNLFNKNNGDSLCLQTIYKEHLYQNRNRIAHNTKSFQQNLPTLERLKRDDYQYENYFLWFSILILIDEVFMELYKVYLETLEQKKFI